MNLFHWIADRCFTIIGVIICSIAVILIVIHCMFNALGIDYLVGNVLVNTILAIGVAIYKHGQKKDAYRNYDGP